MLTDAELKRVIFEAKMVITALVNDEPCGFKAGTVLLKLNTLVENHNHYIISSWSAEDVILKAHDMGLHLTDEEACILLDFILHQNDEHKGIDWDAIGSTIQELYPEKVLARTTILEEILESFS